MGVRVSREKFGLIGQHQMNGLLQGLTFSDNREGGQKAEENNETAWHVDNIAKMNARAN
jgi:hypothetical protein